MTLKQQTISGIKWTSGSGLIVAGLLLVQNIILSHFLSHADFGIIALLQVIVGFINIFIDMGVSNAVIYKQEISHSQLSSLYWMNVASGILFFVIVATVSPAIAWFYEKPELQPYIVMMSFSFIITSISRQYRVLLQKRLRFDLIAKLEIIATCMSFVVCIAVAYFGFGVLSIVIGTLLNNFIQAFFLFIIGIKIHKPSLKYKRKELKELLSFGRFQMGEKILNYFFTQLDTILIGKLLSVEILGVYSIAKTLVLAPVQLINPIITKVTFPVMSKIQNDDATLKRIYYKTLSYLSAINFPIYIVMILLAQPIILMLYGQQWIEATYILQILSITFLIRSVGNPVGSLLLAKGRADLGFYWVLSLLAVIPVCIFFGSLWGINEVCYTLLALQIILYYPGYHFLVKKLIPATFKDYSLNFVKPLVFSLIAAIGAYIWVVTISNNYLKIGLVITTGGLIYTTLHYFFNKSFIKAIKEFV